MNSDFEIFLNGEFESFYSFESKRYKFIFSQDKNGISLMFNYLNGVYRLDIW